MMSGIDFINWTLESDKSIFDLDDGSTVLILFKSEMNGVTIDNGQTIDISFMRTETQIITLKDRYYPSDILAWGKINGLTEAKSIKDGE